MYSYELSFEMQTYEQNFEIQHSYECCFEMHNYKRQSEMCSYKATFKSGQSYTSLALAMTTPVGMFKNTHFKQFLSFHFY